MDEPPVLAGVQALPMTVLVIMDLDLSRMARPPSGIHLRLIAKITLWGSRDLKPWNALAYPLMILN